MTATIDGVAWTGAINVAAIATGNALVVTGASDLNTSNQILVSFSTPAAVGTQTVGLNNPLVGTLVTAPPLNWIAAGPSGSGTLTVSTLTATNATGTFSFVMTASIPGSAPTRVVTNGAFNARIPTP
jgi:hypothetical protein